MLELCSFCVLSCVLVLIILRFMLPTISWACFSGSSVSVLVGLIWACLTGRSFMLTPYVAIPPVPWAAKGLDLYFPCFSFSYICEWKPMHPPRGEIAFRCAAFLGSTLFFYRKDLINIFAKKDLVLQG